MRVIYLCAALVLSACATQPIPTEMDQEQLIEAETELSTGVAAADALLKLGEQARLNGDYASAVNHLERGLRLAPRSAALYLAMAKTRLAMGDQHRAQQMAKKALSLLPAKPRGPERVVQIQARGVMEQVRGGAVQGY